jgi:hypothetical protein
VAREVAKVVLGKNNREYEGSVMTGNVLVVSDTSGFLYGSSCHAPHQCLKGGWPRNKEATSEYSSLLVAGIRGFSRLQKSWIPASEGMKTFREPCIEGCSMCLREKAKVAFAEEVITLGDDQLQPLIVLINIADKLLTGNCVFIFGDSTELLPEVRGKSCQEFGKVFRFQIHSPSQE